MTSVLFKALISYSVLLLVRCHFRSLNSSLTNNSPNNAMLNLSYTKLYNKSGLSYFDYCKLITATYFSLEFIFCLFFFFFPLLFPLHREGNQKDPQVFCLEGSGADSWTCYCNTKNVYYRFTYFFLSFLSLHAQLLDYQQPQISKSNVKS